MKVLQEFPKVSHRGVVISLFALVTSVTVWKLTTRGYDSVSHSCTKLRSLDEEILANTSGKEWERRVVMLNKSPLMRPTFTPSQNRTTVEALSTRINNILNLLDTPSKSRQASSDQPHPAWRESETVMMAEIQRIQEVITDLIALFQDYRSSIDDQLENLAKDVCNMESRVESIVEERLSKIKQELRDEANDNIMKSFHRLDENGFFDQVVLKALQKQKLSQSLPIHRCEVSLDDLDNLKEELALVKDAEIQIIAKINAISSANTDCHEKSAEAIKSIRDVLTNHQLISR